MSNNTVYIAVEVSFSTDGVSENLIGVFSGYGKAAQALQKCLWFDKAKRKRRGLWEYVYDGELTICFEVREIEIDKPYY